MDALILSCGTGGGHDAAGKAIQDALLRRGHHAVMMNPYTLKSPQLAEKINKAYISVAQKAPNAFGLIYGAGQVYRRLPVHSPVYWANKKMVPVMQRFLKQNHFDIVIMPHVFPGEILTIMKQRGISTPKTMFISTDYVCIPFTEETDCDAYVIPHPELAPSFTARGIAAERIYPLGIPVHRNFSAPISRQEAKEQLGLEQDRRYILITGGSIGASKMKKAVHLLLNALGDHRKMHIIVICGNNHALYENLRRQSGTQITVLGQTDQMSLYLRACQLYITKPGGLSSTEAAVAGVPLVHLPPIPGCESYNLRFFTQYGMSHALELTEKGIREALQLMEDSESNSAMIRCQKNKICRDSAAQICDLAESIAAK